MNLNIPQSPALSPPDKTSWVSDPNKPLTSKSSQALLRAANNIPLLVSLMSLTRLAGEKSQNVDCRKSSDSK